MTCTTYLGSCHGRSMSLSGGGRRGGRRVFIQNTPGAMSTKFIAPIINIVLRYAVGQLWLMCMVYDLHVLTNSCSSMIG